ncbi:MAG: PEP-CTERM sorting domain-containing protein, partial [Pirellulaceae bacterium]|nr:PEP-CTERM sorting domain-containing protein [Pirellulaceae bacterium]
THDNVGGYYGGLDVDLSAVANESSVMLRFRQYEPSDDWWIAVDNVVIDDVAGQGPADTVVFSESFDNGLGNMSASGLRSGVNTWNTSAPTTIYDENDPLTGDAVRCKRVNRIEHNGNGPDFACVMKSTTAADEWMMTPVLDFSQATEVVLSYEDECRPGNRGDTYEVYFLLDDGDGIAEANGEDTILETLFTYDGIGIKNSVQGRGSEDAYYALRHLLVDSAVGQAGGFFAFRLGSAGTADSDYFWAIDNVEVSVTLVPEPSTLALLLGGLLMGWIGWRRR